MTVTEKSSRKRITGSGWANPLTHDFELENSTHLKVYADDELLVLGTDYSITGVGVDSGYSVTITSPSSWAPDMWVLMVEPPVLQGDDVSLSGVFGARFEEGLDSLTRRVQRVWEGTRRAWKTPITEDDDNARTIAILPEGHVPVADEDGNLIDGGEFSTLQPFRYVGLWSSTTTYIRNDIVSYGGSLWFARQTSLNSTPAETADWTLFLESAGQEVISADLFGAVLDGTPGDLALIKLAWQYAVAINKPFIVPDRGLPTTLSGQAGGVVVNVPEDFATLQLAIAAIRNWIFPAMPPVLASATPAGNHLPQVAVTISMLGVDGLDGFGHVSNHPHGDQIEIRPRAAVGMTLAGPIGITGPSSGYYDITLPFVESTSDILVGHAFRCQLPLPSFHTGKWYVLDGSWPVIANNTGTNTVTVRVKTVGLASLPATLTAGAGIFVHQNGGVRVINMAANGDDTGCFDLHTTLRIRDLIVRGDPSNSADTDGIMVRPGGKLFANRCSIFGHQRGAIRSLNAYVFADACGLNDNNWGLNIQASQVHGTYTSVNGNATGVVLQENATGRMAQLRACACATGLRTVGRAHLLCGSGLYFNDNDIGADVDVGAYMNLGDAHMVDNTTAPWRVKPGGSLVHTSYANVIGTGTPPASSGLCRGGGYVGLDIQTADLPLLNVDTATVPIMLIGGSSAGITFGSTPTMYSHVVNRICKVIINFTLTSKGGLTGAVTVSNLVFAPTTSILPGGIGSANFDNMDAAFTKEIRCKVAPGANILSLWKSGGASLVALDGADLTNTTVLAIEAEYRVP